MKYFLMLAALVLGFMGLNNKAMAQASVSIGVPGFYGVINVGGYPQPQVIYQQPRIIEYVPNNQAPIYMRVPRNHRRNWGKHCQHYNACRQRVYFVRNDWYRREYAPRYHEQQGGYGGERGNEHHDNGKHRGHGGRN